MNGACGGSGRDDAGEGWRDETAAGRGVAVRNEVRPDEIRIGVSNIIKCDQ